MENKINPQVWDQGTPGWAHQAEPVIIVLRDPTRFPNRKKYPLRREAREGLQPLINKFLACGLLVPTNSLCNTLILPIKKKDETWWLAQDLQIINEPVVPPHPTVPNPYVILGEIPPSAKWFIALDFKDAFFCIPLAKEFQYLFALKLEAPGKKTPTDNLDSIASGVQR